VNRIYKYIVLVIGACLILGCPNSSVKDDIVTGGDIIVDLSESRGAPTYMASGFLTGFDVLSIPKFQNPDIQLVKDLKIRNYRGSGHRGPNIPGDPDSRVLKYTETIQLPSWITGAPEGVMLWVGVEMFDYSTYPPTPALTNILAAMKEEYDYLMEVSDGKAVYQLFFPDIYTEWSVGANPFPGDPQDMIYDEFYYNWNNPFDGANGTGIVSPDNDPALWGTQGRYDWRRYINFCTKLAEFVCDNNMENNFEYDLWNEPDLLGWNRFAAHAYCNFWHRTEDQYFRMWEIGTNTIKGVHADKGKPGTAKIAGPSFASDGNTELTGNIDQWTRFFAMAKDKNVLPDIVTMHALDGDPVKMTENLKNRVLVPLGITKKFDYYMNEYGGQAKANSNNPGNMAWYMAALERAGARGGRTVWARLYNDAAPPYSNDWPWNAPGQTGELCSVFRITPGGEFKPVGDWWAYKRYADITGEMYMITKSDTVDGVAGADSSKREARILLGAKPSSFTAPYWYNVGSISIRIDGIGQHPYLLSSGKVHVTIEKIQFAPDPENSIQGGIPAGKVVEDLGDSVFDADITVKNGSILLPIIWTDSRDAYSVIITHP